MVYNTASLREIIGRVFNTYDIKSADFINRVPQWTGEALGQLNIYMGLEPAKMRVEVNEYKAKLPSTLKKLVAVEYDGNLIPRIIGTRKEYITTGGLSESLSETKLVQDIEYDDNGQIISVRMSETEIPVTRTEDYNYILNKNGFIDFSIETAELVVYFKKLPEEIDPQTGAFFPLIPDVEEVKEAISWYILKSILYRGYKHPILNLNSNNRYVNPAMQWDHYKPIAENKASAPDREQRELHSLMWRGLILNMDSFEDSFVGKIQ